MTSSRWRRWATLRSALSAAGAVVVALAVGACGGSGDDSKGGSSASSGSDSALVNEAKRIEKQATTGLVYSKTDSPQPSDIEPYGEWRGPTSAPPIKPNASVQVIACTKQSPACLQAATAAQAAGKILGWKVSVIDGAGTPQGFARAFDTAFSRTPDAIIGIAVPTAAVTNKLKQARSKGIVTVAVGDVRPADGQGYDAYVGFRMPVMEALLAYAEIARTNGKSNSLVVTDPGFPSLIQAMGAYSEVMKQCSGCKTKTVKWQITDAADPTKVDKIISSALATNPDATTITLPYGIGLPAVVQAVRQAGKADDVTILAKDADPVGLQAVAEGGVLWNAGASAGWAGYAAMDQVVRGLAKKPYLDDSEIGLGVFIFSKETAPKDGNLDSWPGMVDYAEHYREVWGKGS